MDFPAGGTIFRGDLNAYVEEAMEVDEMFIADQLSPPIPVNLKEGQYPKLKQGDYQLISAANSPRAPGAQYPERTASIDRDTFACVDYGLVGVVDESWEDYFGRYNLNLQSKEASTTARNLRMGYEYRVANLYFNTSNWTSTNVTASYLTANIGIATGANPIIDIQRAITKIAANGWKADTVVMSMNVYNYITQTLNFQNFYKPYGVGQAGQIADLNAVKKAFESWGIDKVFASYLNYNTSNTSTVSLSPIWSDSYIWVGKRGTGNIASGAGGAGCTFFWQQRGSFYQTESWYDIDRDATKVRVRMYETEKILDSTAGILISTGYTGS